MNLSILLISGLALGGVIGCLGGCSSDQLDSDEKIARQYCGSCHQFPEPDLLDRNTWTTGVLPEMARRLGVGDPNFNPYFKMTPDEIELVIRAGVYPDKPAISKTNWEKIVRYYTEHAPEEPLPQAGRPPISDSLDGFSVRQLPVQRGQVPVVTYVGIAPVSHELYFGDRRCWLYRMQSPGRVVDSIPTESPVVDIDFGEGYSDLLEIGKMDPNDWDNGSLWRRQGDRVSLLQEKLFRPVSITRADLNGDGLADRIVCQHGNHTGRLSWYENRGNGVFAEHVLRQMPGARRAIATDWNKDGKTDILCLFAQGQEGIYLFLNKGDAHFEGKKLLGFSPVYGSSYIEVADMNGDGNDDIVYTNGDNADYSNSLKRYHGVRIFLNEGNDKLREAWFFPVNGASKALVNDFDRDGDLDMAVISFFADPQKNDGFLFFQNQGGLRFTASTFPQASLGKWLVATSGDWDKDGDDDIVLGSFLLKSMGDFKFDPQNPPPVVIVLENQLEKGVNTHPN